VEAAATNSLKPFERKDAENAYQVQHDLQSMMQDLVGIVRREGEMRKALEGLSELERRARKVGVEGNREYNPGWHTALDLPNLLTISQAIARAAIERKESRGGHFREDYPDKNPEFAKFNILIRKAADGSMQVSRQPIPEMPDSLRQVIDEMK
jgi:succinate dehydrogenase / fumarate reductase flavoprotein subunit